MKIQKDTTHFGTLASHIIGFTGSDNQGLDGIEAKYDDILSGEKGKIVRKTDAKGKVIGSRRRRVYRSSSG